MLRMQTCERIHFEKMDLPVLVLAQIYATAIATTQCAPGAQCERFDLTFESACG